MHALFLEIRLNVEPPQRPLTRFFPIKKIHKKCTRLQQRFSRTPQLFLTSENLGKLLKRSYARYSAKQFSHNKKRKRARERREIVSIPLNLLIYFFENFNYLKIQNIHSARITKFENLIVFHIRSTTSATFITTVVGRPVAVMRLFLFFFLRQVEEYMEVAKEREKEIDIKRTRAYFLFDKSQNNYFAFIFTFSNHSTELEEVS